MDPITRRFSDLELAIDDTHALFAEWIDAADAAANARTLHHACLVLHEWLANLVQHADFQGRTPEVAIRLFPSPNKIRCVVVDNSKGFELEHRLEMQTTNALPFPERATVLRFIDARTDSISYHRIGGNRHQFEFSISTDHTPWLSNLF